MSRQPLPEVLHEVALPPFVATETRDGSGKDIDELEAVVIVPVSKDEPIVTRKVCPRLQLCLLSSMLTCSAQELWSYYRTSMRIETS